MYPGGSDELVKRFQGFRSQPSPTRAHRERQNFQSNGGGETYVQMTKPNLLTREVRTPTEAMLISTR